MYDMSKEIETLKQQYEEFNDRLKALEKKRTTCADCGGRLKKTGQEYRHENSSWRRTLSDEVDRSLESGEIKMTYDCEAKYELEKLDENHKAHGPYDSYQKLKVLYVCEDCGEKIEETREEYNR